MNDKAKNDKDTVKKVSFKERTTFLKQQLEKTKQQLQTLEERRKLELGALAIKAGLADHDDKVLAKEFAALAGRL